MLKNTTPVICAMALAMVLLSCAREVLEPGQMITGKYAPDDGSGLASEYISFDGGELGLYRSQSDVLFTFAENKFWDCSKSTFLTTIGYRYSIQSGMMSSGFYSGPAELTGDKLKLGSKTYTRLDGFEQEKYSSIEVESELTVPYNSGGTFTPLSISRPIAAGKISASASSSSSWITGVKVEDGELRFNYSETKNPRDGYITITYTNAQSRTIMVHQRPSTYIVLPSAANTVDYTGQSVSIPYSITGPVAGSSLSAKCSATWVKNISVTSSAVECTVDENTGNTSRKATFTLSYSGAADVTYVLTQDWASTSITTSPGALSCDYTGGSFSFGVNVQNPRSGVVVTATSQVAWITDVSVAGNRVTYTVGENNSAVSRTGKIKLTYGSFATAEFSITQTGKPVHSITLNKTALSLHPGDVETLVASVDPSDAVLSWTSSNSAVATVSTTGKVTAVGNGNAVITASATDGSGKKATCAVTVTTLVTGVSLNKTSLVLNEGGSETLTATITPSTASDKSVTWSSTNTSVATVNSSGKVTAVAAGTATITATAKDGSGKKASCAVTVRTVVDLSSSGTANCYIVTGAGFYKFKTVKGNSSTSVGTVSSVSVLWETFGTSTAVSVGDLVSNVSYENGYISFEASSKKGNALIAAKNSSGKILWSWHIWMTNKPADQTYRNSAGKMMDRNLGATSATAGDVKALGLLYQWGRKDPFLAGQTISSSTNAMSTLNSWTAVSVSSALAGNTSLNYSIENPTAFIYNGSDPYDWYCTSSSYQNNSLWSSSKSIYDPCPPGYQIPPGGANGVWAKAAGSSTLPTWNSTSLGCEFGGVFTSSGSCWYPAPGQRVSGSGSISSASAGKGGYYWSYTLNGSSVYELWLEISSGVNVKTQVTTKYRASGRSVRCIKI